MMKASSYEYLFDLGGRAVTELIAGTTTTNRTESYAGGRHLAVQNVSLGSTWFIHTDWLGTERVRTSLTGGQSETCVSLSYGDNLTCTGADVSPLHFTGKMHDNETGLDDFPARYYSSAQGRWYSPDWASAQVPVPYANLGNPQTLNLYDYVGSDPTNHADADGHATNEQSNSQKGACADPGSAACGAQKAQANTGQADAKTAQNIGAQIASYSTISEPISFGTGNGDQSSTQGSSDHWVNPTGGAVRGCDAGGCGEFGAPRNEGLGATHGGTDYVATPGQDVVAVHDGNVTGTGYAYQGDSRLQIVKIQTPNGYTASEMYVKPASEIKNGTHVSAGQVIGTAQDIRVRTGPKVTPHVHVQIRDSAGQRVNPETLIPAP